MWSYKWDAICCTDAVPMKFIYVILCGLISLQRQASYYMTKLEKYQA